MAVTALVWLANGDTVSDERLGSYLPWLGADEQTRYASFTRRLRARQFLIGRILLRQLLGQLLGRPAALIQLTAEGGAAPRLLGASDQTPGLSLSHSGPWVVCAASMETPLGIDVEVIDYARDVQELAEYVFPAAEIIWQGKKTAAERTRAFFDRWCEAEARLKLGSENGHCIRIQHDVLAAVLCSEYEIAQEPIFQLHQL